MSLPVLYDGWALARAPNSPPALHLLALLAHLPPQVEPLIALPEEPQEAFTGLPELVRSADDTAFGRLVWEQAHLPRLARRSGARLLHLTTPTPPLFGKPISVISPSNFGFGYAPERAAGKSFGERARAAAAQGGLARARAVFWPADLPAPETGGRFLPLPPITLEGSAPGEMPAERPQKPGANGSKAGPAGRSRVFRLADLDLPETFILYHGPESEAALNFLLEAWSWAAGPIGAYHPLLMLGLGQAGRAVLEKLLSGSGLGDSLKVLPQVAPGLVPAIYASCTALFHPARTSAWGGPVRQALALGKPVVACEDERTSAIAGPAAYLVPQGQARALGAALITVVVEEQVAGQLSRAALERAAGWESDTFGDRLWQAYQAILEGS